MKSKKQTKNLIMFKEFADNGLLPKSQIEQSKIFGVRESTLNGWLNDKSDLPKYATKILFLLVLNSAIEENLWDKIRELNSAFPVEHNGKIMLIKHRWNFNAVYANQLTGDVLAECNDIDNASYILDFIN